MQALKPHFDRRAAATVVISFAEPAKLIRYQEYHRWPFTLLADPKRATYEAFTLRRLSWLRLFSLATLRQYFKLMREGRKIRSYGKEDYQQAGGDFLVGDDGTVLFAHRSQDPADRPVPTRLLEEVDRFRNQAAGQSTP